MASGMGDARPDWLDDWLDDWLNYPVLTAVQRDALFFVHPDPIQRPTSRVLLGARTVCEALAAARTQVPPSTR